MSTFEFQLYVTWFRFLRIVRVGRSHLERQFRERIRHVPEILRWLRAVLLAPLALSFELYILAWEDMKRVFRERFHRPLHKGHRALFCLVLSLTGWQFLFFLLSGGTIGISPWTIGLSLAHGLVVQFTWKRGARFFRQVLGLRPGKGLDLGN